MLFGEAGDDLLRGGKGADQIVGGAGDDTLWGGENGINDTTCDTFAFDRGCGSDRIADFEAGIDTIALSELLVGTGNDPMAALFDSDDGAVLDLTALNGQSGDSIVFVGLTLEDLTANDPATQSWTLIA